MAKTKSTLSGVSGIYQIRCLANGKVYVGSAVDLKARWKAHCGLLSRGNHHSVILQNAWTKHGADQFVFEVLEIVGNKADLIRIEQEYLDRFQPFAPTDGFNTCQTAGSCLGTKHSPETLEKMSKAHKGLKASPEACANRSKALKGRTFTPEWLAKIKESKKGLRLTPEHRANIGIAAKGRKHTPETIAKMSIVQGNRRRRPAKGQRTFSFD